MAVRDHTGRTRSSNPFDGTLTSSSDASQRATWAGHSRPRRRGPMTFVDHASIPPVSPGYVKTSLM